MNHTLPIVYVAIPRPIAGTLEYTYLPDTPYPSIGARVVVPLGRSRCVGMVTALARHSSLSQPEKLRAIERVIDQKPLLDTTTLALLQWASAYYHYPLGEVIFTALPVMLRAERSVPAISYWQTLPANAEALTSLKRAKKQWALYEWLQSQGKTEASLIQQSQGVRWKQTLATLQERELVTEVMEEISCTPKPLLPKIANPLTLTTDQKQCIAALYDMITQTEIKPILLHGVTGSGKTEIYLRIMESVLRKGKQVIVLVPEISLTPQLLTRFTQYYGEEKIVCLHSALSKTERMQAWLRASKQSANIIIGTRSAVFTPCPQLGMIIIDEEHDLSFKQQEGFRYHGRDLAIKRAHTLGIPIILGSATPALETLHNADQQRYHYLHLANRPNKTRPPRIEVQNIKGKPLQAGLSQYTLTAIQTTLAQNEQVMLFINRRGFAPLLHCPQCGWASECQHCSANMTYHARRSRLICHHCTSECAVPSTCPQCHHSQLSTRGQGTERLELMLTQHFPDTTVIRIDRDSTTRKGTLQHYLDMIQSNEPAILIGTQMLAKGHDFPNLTLVVILDTDHALYSAEYHALERFGQLLVQVAGRSGRAEKMGSVILQTEQPEHPALLTLLQQGYLAFARQLLLHRQQWQYPPFGYQALIRANASDLGQALQTLETMKQHLAQIRIEQLQLLGPISALMEKRAGRYRVQLLLQSPQRKSIHHALSYLTGTFKNLKLISSVRWSFDVDPMDLS